MLLLSACQKQAVEEVNYELQFDLGILDALDGNGKKNIPQCYSWEDEGMKTLGVRLRLDGQWREIGILNMKNGSRRLTEVMKLQVKPEGSHYTLNDFELFAVDEDGEGSTIMAVPYLGTELAQFVDRTLPYKFNPRAFRKNAIQLDLLCYQAFDHDLEEDDDNEDDDDEGGQDDD